MHMAFNTKPYRWRFMDSGSQTAFEKKNQPLWQEHLAPNLQRLNKMTLRPTNITSRISAYGIAPGLRLRRPHPRKHHAT
jgi:hypothetical protein